MNIIIEWRMECNSSFNDVFYRFWMKDYKLIFGFKVWVYKGDSKTKKVYFHLIDASDIPSHNGNKKE